MKKIINLLFLVACGAQAEIVFVNSDEANEGLNDLTPVEPVGGNSGETIGQQRAIVLQAAADIIEDALDISAPLEISIDFKSLTCTTSSDGSTSAILGVAGPTGIATDIASRTFTPNSLYNHLWTPLIVQAKSVFGVVQPSIRIPLGLQARSLMNFANPVLISLSFPKNVVRNRVSGLRSYLLDI